MPCPYSAEDKDTVKMVRHDHESIYFDMLKMVRNFIPVLPDDFTESVHSHLV
jgi:hypothetical protein